MSSSPPAAPPAPDPVATAQAQGQINADTARLQGRMNRVDQYTPQGSTTFTDLGNDRFRSDTTLSPDQQGLLDLSNKAQSTYGTAALSQLQSVAGQLSNPFQFQGPAMQFGVPDRAGSLQTWLPDRSGDVVRGIGDRNSEVQRGVQNRTGDVTRSYGISDRPDYTGIGDPNQARSDVEGALMARLNPQLETQRAGLEARLTNQGITPGSQAWNTGMGDFGRLSNDARLGVIANAGQEQSRVVGLGLQQAGFGNDARAGQATFQNAATGQIMANDLDRGNFANSSTNQLLQSDLARGQFQNAAVQQAYGMDLGRSTFANQAQQQAYGMDMGAAQLNNQARGQSLAEQLQLRAQPINEAAALLTGQQIQYPQYQNYPQVGVQPADYQSAQNAQQAALNTGYQGKVGTANANAQGQAGVGAAAIAAAGTTAAAVIA